MPEGVVAVAAVVIWLAHGQQVTMRNGGYRWVGTLKPEAVRWVRSLRDQCVAAGVPFFFKQWGGRTPKTAGRYLDGRTWDEYPRELGA